MKRILKTLFLCISLLLIFQVLLFSAHAHSGRTDGNGGHYDHSTGDYHYHHGYPAHDHYDMDGNGTADCPYDFDDKTSHKSSGSTRSNSNENSSSQSQTSRRSTATSGKKISIRSIWDSIRSALGILLGLSGPIIVLGSWLIDKIRSWHSKLKNIKQNKANRTK